MPNWMPSPTPSNEASTTGPESPSLAEARSRLASKQASLVRALVAGAEVPAGFDRERIARASRSLQNKRIHEVGRSWPALIEALGRSFSERFRRYASENPPPAHGGPQADGRRFLQTIPRDEWTESLVRQALAVDLIFRQEKDGLHPRVGPALLLARRKNTWRPLVGIRFPGQAPMIW
ncbi:MAG: hypothetical protein ACKO23_10405 [Gemmataceae bacterium]